MRRLLCPALAACLLVSSASAHAAALEKDAYLEVRAELAALRADAARRKLRHNWLRLVRTLDRLGNDPKHPHRCEALYLAGGALRDLAELSYLEADRLDAAARFEKLGNDCPRSTLADDGLVAAAELLLTHDPLRARRALEQSVQHHARGDQLARARALLSALPAPPKREPEPIPKPKTNRLPTTEEILAALDARGADAKRPADVELERDLAYDAALRAKTGATDPIATGASLTLPEDKSVSVSLAAGLKIRRVVLDAGHGGHDTGAIGRSGLREKDVALAITKKLKSKLEALGLEVLLTRDRDEFLELEERTRFANERRADLFVSIHCNAAHNRKARGVETYTLNLNADKYAMRLAARENATSKRRVGDLDLILADLATKANTDDSVRLASVVQSELAGSLRRRFGGGVRDLGVKQALFFVLVGAKMPSILVETSFLSNPEEEKLLRSDAYREAIARSIAKGLERFLSEREAIARGPGGGVY